MAIPIVKQAKILEVANRMQQRVLKSLRSITACAVSAPFGLFASHPCNYSVKFNLHQLSF